MRRFRLHCFIVLTLVKKTNTPHLWVLESELIRWRQAYRWCPHSRGVGGNCHVIPLVLANTSAWGNRGGAMWTIAERRRRWSSVPIPPRGSTSGTKATKIAVTSASHTEVQFFFMTLSIFNDINALKRLGCQPPEAQWDVQPSDASQATETGTRGRRHRFRKMWHLEGKGREKKKKQFSCRSNGCTHTCTRTHVHAST